MAKRAAGDMGLFRHEVTETPVVDPVRGEALRLAVGLHAGTAPDTVAVLAMAQEFTAFLAGA